MRRVATAPLITAEEFVRRPLRETAGIEELIRGRVIVHDPLMNHQLAVGSLYAALLTYTRAEPGRGIVTLNIDTGISHDTVLQPDVQWWTEGRQPTDYLQRPQPLGDIVVEARSPSTWKYDIGVKREIYEEAGTRELWLVDQYAMTVLVLTREDGSARFGDGEELAVGETLTSPLLSGFAMPVAEVFRELL